MVGAAAFLLIFLLIAPVSRNFIGARIGEAGSWLEHWAPFSYIILGLLAVAGVVSIVLTAKWPEVEEPENPLARYKNADDVIAD